ncbi:MAG: hypothetical protein AAF410_01630 [Pseudomonadota bacterium]
MNQYHFNKEEDDSVKTERVGMQSLNEATQDIVSIIVRISGLVLLFIGLWIAIQVFHEALSLYKDPANIERIAQAIESGSNIDKSITPLKDSLLGEEASDNTNQIITSANSGIRISYFIAWVIDILLLLLLARISIMAIKTGGELALYDAQIKKLARQLVKAKKDNESS